ncbi:integrase catalytic domain-containing protein [Pseudomonas umsongensis]|jgi:putative transposase|uniref:Transposase family protein n=1 Tax=Pseudomonas umsongensis TaxID=198618 RepID=A0AAE6ZX67_9PSED|nr:DDE-type integrase/transposase/recombinase [Pseudomonas umsongensis]QJC80403.1 transposase family protein [Pseudomonas umsongensis]
MGIFEFKIGEHYRYRGQRLQIVDLQGECVQLRAIEGRRIVLRQTRDILLRAMKRGDLVKDQEAPIEKDPQKIIAGLPKPYAAAFDRHCYYTRGLMDELHGRMPARHAQSLINRLAKQINDICPPSLSTARSWVRTFCKSGYSYLSLIPGRKKKWTHRLEHQPKEVQEIINQQVKELYLKSEPACKTEVIDAIVLELEAFNEGRPKHDRLRIPSESTLNRILRELDANETACAQHGSKYAQKKQGWTRKRPRSGRLFELVEADTQQMHVMVVNDHGEVIGRPYLTVFLEIYTRMPYAWCIGFNPPSLDTTLQALKQSLSSDNIYGGVALRYVFDSGPEFVADNLRRIIALLGGEVCYCEPATGNQKPHVEAFFGVWSKEIAHAMPGTTFSNVAARSDYNSEKNARLTIEAVRDAFGRWVNDVYCERVHSSLNTSPRLAWKAAYTAMFPPRRYSPSELRLHFLSAFKASPQQGRLRYNSLFWTGPGVPYLANREPKVDKLHVYYDPSDLGHAWACHPSYPNELLELQAVDPDYQQGLTMHLHQLTLKRLRTEREAFNPRKARQARLALLRELAKVKTPAQRRQHQRAVETGSLQRSRKHPVKAATSKPKAPESYRNHGNTPDDYSSVDV